MRKYFHKGNKKWGNSANKTCLVYGINKYAYFFSTKHISQKQVLKVLKMVFAI